MPFLFYWKDQRNTWQKQGKLAKHGTLIWAQFYTSTQARRKHASSAEHGSWPAFTSDMQITAWIDTRTLRLLTSSNCGRGHNVLRGRDYESATDIRMFRNINYTRRKMSKLYIETCHAYEIKFWNFDRLWSYEWASILKTALIFQVSNWGCRHRAMITRFYFRILDSISSRLSPLVSGTTRITNTRESTAMTPNRKNILAGPRNSCGTQRSIHCRQIHNSIVCFHICAK
jgi:hypothetical protein